MAEMERSAVYDAEGSEQKHKEALARIDAARRKQAEDDVVGAQDELAAAWVALDDALRLFPRNHRARFLLVSCAMNADDYERAKKEALQIYELLSQEQLVAMGDSVLHLSLAHATKMLGETEEAMRYASEAAELYPFDPQPMMVLGELNEAQGRLPDAERGCREALRRNEDPQTRPQLRLSPQNFYFTLCCLGSSLLRQGKFAEAEPVIRQALKEDRSSRSPTSTLSRSTGARGGCRKRWRRRG